MKTTFSKQDLKQIIHNIGIEVGQLRSPIKTKKRDPSSKFIQPTAKSEHYRLEIVRNWNKINYLVQKVSRSISNRPKHENIDLLGMLYFLAYRIRFEKISIQQAISEWHTSKIAAPRKFIQQFIKRVKSFRWDIALKSKKTNEILSLRHAIPSFCIDRLSPVMKMTEIKTLFQKMDQRAISGTFTLRVNSLQLPTYNTSEFIIELEIYFQKNALPFSQDQHYPILYHIPMKFKGQIVQSKFYLEGKIIIQDKASIATIECLDPQPNELIGDFCAAPGMKTSMIAQWAQNRASIVAGDFHQPRLRSIESLQTTLNMHNLHPMHMDALNPPFQNRKFDKILLDAPCTGSGTFTSNPELKWRQNTRFLHQTTQLQKKMLHNTLEYLKPDGILVYSTCSLYPEEGELQINAICDKVKFLEMPVWISSGYDMKNDLFNITGRLHPHIHHTTGFFIAKMQKK